MFPLQNVVVNVFMYAFLMIYHGFVNLNEKFSSYLTMLHFILAYFARPQQNLFRVEDDFVISMKRMS